ncbi:MAG: hypothetical protein HY482_02805 [Candidatus Wildermuthbacteria bacterium]|nr:hypothetical protein [Candidatus Wildermuthbacteria bacterium]
MSKGSEITRQILAYIAFAGVLGVAVTAPHALVGMARLYASFKKISPEQAQIRRIAQALASAKRSKLIIVREKSEGKFLVELSEKGKRKLKEIEYDELKILPLERWDGKWRIIIFDIPKTFHKSIRNAFTIKLKKLGFCVFQKSVWAHAYPCENEIRFLAEFYGVSRFVHSIVADSITNDAALRRYFF